LRKAAVAALALLALAGAACSDEGPRTSNTTAPTAGTVTVEIPEFRFDPPTLRIRAGTAVVWRNTHNQAHTSTGAGEMRWNTGNVAPGAASAPVAFPTPGTFPYFCALHPFMKGTVEVSS
jgi:plastocyanin